MGSNPIKDVKLLVYFMKKIIEKDKIIRKKIQTFEKTRLILKSINYNIHFSNLTRWKTNKSLLKIPSKSSKTFVSNKCIYTVNKKKFNKLTNFSRIKFLRLVKSKNISNVYKSSW